MHISIILDKTSEFFRFLRHRRAWASSSCLASQSKPHTASFSQLRKAGTAEESEYTYDLQCFPLYSLLMAAAGNLTVNYLSLDIEGAELEVLQSVPWERVDIEVLTVETVKVQEVRQYLKEQGYVHVYTIEG